MKLKENGPVSFSRLQKFESCPWAFYQRYELKMPEPAGEAAEFGNLVHAVIAEAISRNCDSDIDSFDTLCVDIAAGELESNPREGKKIADLWNKYAGRYGEIKRLTLKALDLVQDTKGAVLEQYFCKKLPCGVEFQGYIDFMVPGKTIYDWKTGHNYKNYLESPQLALYAWGIDELQAEKSYVFLQFDKPVFRDTYSIKKAVEWANTTCKQIEFAYEIAEEEGPKEGFPKKPGAPCQWCGFKEQCAEETAEKLEIVIPESAAGLQEAQEAAKTLLHLETLVDKTKAVLKDYCENNGPFELNGEWFAIYPGTTRKEWDKPGIYNLIKELPEEDILKILSIDSRGVDAVIKEYPFLEEALRQFLTEKTGTPNFKHQKSPPKEVGISRRIA